MIPKNALLLPGYVNLSAQLCVKVTVSNWCSKYTLFIIHTHKHFIEAVISIAHIFLCPAGQDDPAREAEAPNAEGAQQAVQGG